MEQNQSPNEQPKNKPIVLIIVVAVLAIAGILAAVMMLQKPKVEVPEVSYYREADARKAISDAKLAVGNVTSKTDEDIWFGGIVLSQSIESGKKVDEGTAIDLVISEGKSLDEPVQVPDLTGMTPEEAENKLLHELFIPQQGEQAYSDTVEPGKVCAQSAAAGTDAMPFQLVVTYSVSLGQEKVKVPDVTGKLVAEARTLLLNAGVSYNETVSYSDNVDKDKVVSQDVAKDTEVAKGSIITINVSLGAKPKTQVLVPNVYNYSLADAKKTLESAGLKFTTEGDTNGTVVSMTPPPNRKVDEGTNVQLKFAVPTPPTPPTPPEPEPEPEPEPVTPKLNEEQCRELALKVFDKDNLATNIISSGILNVGGANCCTIEFDKGDVHYIIVVNADEGTIVEASSNDGVTETIYKSDGTVASTRYLPVG